MTYVRNAWYVAAWAHEIVPDCPLGVRILNEPIVLWRNASGGLVALEDRCVHRLAPLSLGRCEGEKLRCMYHGLLYDRTGRVVEIPGQDRVSASLRARVYPTVERHGWVWVWMGNAAADDSFIPPILGLDHPDYIFGHGQLDYDAEARFVSDNLLDLSHISYLHTESFRYGETWARERPKVTEHERSIRSERWFKSEGALGAAVAAESQVDTYFTYGVFVPGVLLMLARAYPVGTADALHGEPPNCTHGLGTDLGFTSQAITPLTDKTARYFYIFGNPRQPGDAAAREVDMSVTDKAFAEDKTMIEGQQRIIDATPHWRFISTTGDQGAVLFHRMVEKLAREESDQSSQAMPQNSAHR